MQPHTISTKIIAVFLLLSAAIATLVPYAWARWNTGDAWQGVTPELSHDAMFYYARANDVLRGHFFVTNPFFFEHRNEPAAIPSADDVFIALPQLLGLSFDVGYYVNIFFWSVLLLFLCYALLRAFDVSPFGSFLGSVWCYVGVYGGMLRPGSMQIIFPLYALFLLFFWRYLNKKDASILPLAVITGIAPYFYIHLFMTIGATFGVYGFALMFQRKWYEVRRLCLLGAVAFVVVLPHALHGLALSTQPFYWEAMLHNAFLSSHWPQIEAYYYGRWVVLVLLLTYTLRRFYPDAISGVTYFFVSLTGLGILLAMVSNVFTGRDFEIAVHVARFSIFWYLVVGVIFFKPVCLFVFRKSPDAWFKRMIVGSLFALLLLQSIINIGRSLPHFSLMKEQFTEVQSYAGVLEWLTQQPVGVVVAPEDLNSYIPTLTKHYVLYHTYGAHFAVSDEENQERLLLYRAFDRLTEGDFIKMSMEYYGPVPSYLAKTSVLRYRICTLFRSDKNCSAPEVEMSFVDSAALAEKFKAYYPDLVANIAQEYARYHVRYVIAQTGDTKTSGKIPSCVPVYHDQWFEVCAIANQPLARF